MKNHCPRDVMWEVDFHSTSCHSSLPSMILIMADKFEMHCRWWGNAFSYCRGKRDEQNGRGSTDMARGCSMDGCWEWTWEASLWKQLTKQILTPQIIHIIQDGCFECRAHSFQGRNVIDLSPSANAAHLQDILKRNRIKQVSFTETEKETFFIDIFIGLMQGLGQDQQ